MKIGGLAKLTLLDFPNHVACTVFTVGCNLRCPFCHNAGLVTEFGQEEYSEEEILSFLEKRKNVLEGMCLTGGEPLVQAGVADFLRKVKALGYAVKLDTNGTFPQKLRSLVEEGLVDYVAMDVKNSPAAYAATVGCKVDLDAVCQSVEFLKSGKVDYEFRTTVTGTFHTEQSVEEMAKWLAGAKRLFLQKFSDSGNLINKSVVGCTDEQMHRFKAVAQRYVPNTHLRGMEE